jgi:hypothetical protein
MVVEDADGREHGRESKKQKVESQDDKPKDQVDSAKAQDTRQVGVPRTGGRGSWYIPVDRGIPTHVSRAQQPWAKQP